MMVVELCHIVGAIWPKYTLLGFHQLTMGIMNASANATQAAIVGFLRNLDKTTNDRTPLRATKTVKTTIAIQAIMNGFAVTIHNPCTKRYRIEYAEALVEAGGRPNWTGISEMLVRSVC